MKKVLEYCVNLWYSYTRDSKGDVGNMKKKDEPIFSAKDFACYIKEKYSDYTNHTKEITPIKLQKSLYFCLAYWGGFVNKGRIDKVIEEQSNLLFSDRIEAWAYGPVIRDVYFAQTEDDEKTEKSIKKVKEIMKQNSLLEETINSILSDLFEISDFKLVSISHMDSSWKNHFHDEDEQHKEEITHKEIIDEYTAKSFS